MSTMTSDPSGAARLDGFYPNWELIIDPIGLDVASDTQCILGQLFGSFKRGCKELGITFDQAVAEGFHAPQTNEKVAAAYYVAATALWARAVERRMPVYA